MNDQGIGIRHDGFVRDHQVAARGQAGSSCREHGPRVLEVVAAVDENDGVVRERDPRTGAVEDLDELLRVGTDVVVIDLVDDEVRDGCVDDGSAGAHPSRKPADHEHADGGHSHETSPLCPESHGERE